MMSNPPPMDPSCPIKSSSTENAVEGLCGLSKIPECSKSVCSSTDGEMIMPELDRAMAILVSEHGIGAVQKCMRRHSYFSSSESGTKKKWSLSESLRNRTDRTTPTSKQLRKRNEEFRHAIMDASNDPIFCVGEEGVILLTNDAAETQFGWTKEEFLGKNIDMIVGGKRDGRHHNEYIRRYIETGQKRVMGKKRELTAKKKDGREFRIELGLAEIKTQTGEERLFCGFVRDLSQQKQFEQEIKRKHELAMGLLEAAMDPMFSINEEGQILVANEAAENIFGWKKFELIGQNISKIVGREHSAKHDEYIRRYLKTGKKRVMGKKRELWARQKDGTEFPIELGLSEVNLDKGVGGTLFCGFIRDLSEQKENEKKLKEESAITAGIIEASFDAMFAIDGNGIIQMVNDASCKKFGWSRDEFLGENISMIVECKHAAQHDQYLRRYVQTGEKKMIGKQRRVNGRKKDGSVFPLILGLTEIETSSSFNLFVAFIRDVTNE